MYMFAEAIKRAKSADPVKVASQLEGMKFPGDTGEVEMRAVDHQLIQPLYISTIDKAYRDPKSKDPKSKKGTDPAVKYRHRGHWLRVQDGCAHRELRVRAGDLLLDEAPAEACDLRKGKRRTAM